MTAEVRAALTVAGMESRRRLVVTNWRGDGWSRLPRIFAPGVVDGLARKAVREAEVTLRQQLEAVHVATPPGPQRRHG